MAELVTEWTLEFKREAVFRFVICSVTSTTLGSVSTYCVDCGVRGRPLVVGVVEFCLPEGLGDVPGLPEEFVAEDGIGALRDHHGGQEVCHVAGLRLCVLGEGGKFLEKT